VKLLNEFKAFLLQGNLITLAVAFVMGVAFAAVLTSFVSDVITPIIGAVVGKSDFSNLTFTIHNSLFRYGAFITALLTFARSPPPCSSSSSSRTSCSRLAPGGPRKRRRATRSVVTKSCSQRSGASAADLIRI